MLGEMILKEYWKYNQAMWVWFRILESDSIRVLSF